MRYKCMHWNVVALQLYWHNLYESVLCWKKKHYTNIFSYFLTRMSSSSQMRSCTTSSAWPSIVASNVSSPSRLVREGQMVAENGQTQLMSHWYLHLMKPFDKDIKTCTQIRCKSPVAQKPIHKHQHSSTLPPVALAMRLRSLLRTLLTAMAPTSTKYLRHMSSMPPVVRITLAPDAKIFWILSLVMSDSLEQQNPTLFQFHQQYLDKIQFEYNTELSSPQWWYNSSDRSCCLNSGCWYFLPHVSLCKLLVQHHSKFKWDNS